MTEKFSEEGRSNQLRIVFMGTPEFAVASLKALTDVSFNIVGVITGPDKLAGRGMKMNESAVKKFAVENGLHVLQPERLKAPEFLEQLKSLKADLQVVVAFRMLPEVVWNMPKLGTINLHASLLPQYRGAAPINWAIINGEKETGITTFRLRHEIDTGNVLLQKKISIADEMNAGELHDVMKMEGASLLVKTVEGIANGALNDTPQPVTDIQLKHAPKLFTKTCTINWNSKCSEIYNLIRGLSPYPGAVANLDGKLLKIYGATTELSNEVAKLGTAVSDEKTYIKFACADGYIRITDLQLEGKKRMPVADFLRGHKVDSKKKM